MGQAYHACSSWLSACREVRSSEKVKKKNVHRISIYKCITFWDKTAHVDKLWTPSVSLPLLLISEISFICPKMCVIQSVSNKTVRESLPSHRHINYTFSDCNNLDWIFLQNFKVFFFKIEISWETCLLYTWNSRNLGASPYSFCLIFLQPQAMEYWIMKERVITDWEPTLRNKPSL